jgi:hypothetical protein
MAAGLPFILILPLVSVARADPTGTWLPETSLLPPAMADNLEPLPSIQVRSTAMPRVEATLGDTFGLYRLETGSLRLQIDLGAGLFLGFFPAGEMSFGLLTVDGLLQLPVTVARGPYRIRLQWSHVSAHYADGLRLTDDHPDAPSAFSRESLRLLGCWTDGRWAPYAAFTSIVHAIPEADRPGFQAGWSFWPKSTVGLYHAFDLKTQADLDWRPSLSAQVGLFLSPSKGHAFRVGLAAYTGPDDTGQFYGQTERYLGAVVGFLPARDAAVKPTR